MSILPAHLPVIGICGYSGSGKTTLVEALVPRLIRRGLAVAVVKHDAHGLTMDREGKDSDRFFQAGATVVVHDPVQIVRRAHRGGNRGVLQAAVRDLLGDHDVVLVEGHKQTALPLRFWLVGEDGAEPPQSAGVFAAVLPRDGDRLERVELAVMDHVAASQSAQPLCAGLLIGGRSRRMGRPKQMLRSGGRTWAEAVHDALAAQVRQVVLLGDGQVPETLTGLLRLPDAPDKEGPLAGMVAAMRWRPDAAWIFAACDMPLLDDRALAWLLGLRAPGDRVIMPLRPGASRAEPLCAWYAPRARALLEACRQPQDLVGAAGVKVADLPSDLAHAWLGFNSLDQVNGRIEVDDSLPGLRTGKN